MAKVEALERRLSEAHKESCSLKAALQKEQLEKKLREHNVLELERKVKVMEDQQKGLEVILKEKQDTEIEKDRKLSSLKQKAHRANEKVRSNSYIL